METIVAKTGSPVYIYDAAVMREQYKKLESALPEGFFKVYYSMKANPNPAVACVFRRLGAGAEIASKSELAAAIEAGFEPGGIIFAGPGKGVDEIRAAVKAGIGSINVESEAELARVSDAARRKGSLKKAKTKIAFRVNLEYKGGRAAEVMIGGPRKFGVDAEIMEPLVRRAMADPGLEVTGFHCYAGTGFLQAGALAGAYRAFARWAEEMATKLGLKVKTLNFGGGLGIPHEDGEPELDVKALGAAMGKIRSRLLRSPLFEKTRFIIEPGRYLVGPSGVYISMITDLKKSRGRQFIITNGGIHHALIPITLNKNYPTAIINKMDRRKTVECVVAGPLCVSPDQFSRKVRLPRPDIGDLIGIFNSGAYGFSAGMLSFLSHPTPAEALVDNKKLYLIRESKKPDLGVFKRIRI